MSALQTGNAALCTTRRSPDSEAAKPVQVLHWVERSFGFDCNGLPYFSDAVKEQRQFCRNQIRTANSRGRSRFHAKPIPASEQPANQAAEAQRRIDESVRRAIEHYNSASEVAYRREIETKEHFQHLERMNAIKSGATDLELEVMKLRQQQQIQFMENAHAVKEAEWERQEHERR
jgi:hypothetical protein